jgi:hypothetical protein
MPSKPKEKKSVLTILKLNSYYGEHSHLDCGVDNISGTMYVIVSVDLDNGSEIVDAGYPTMESAQETWPEAHPRSSKKSNKDTKVG